MRSTRRLVVVEIGAFSGPSKTVRNGPPRGMSKFRPGPGFPGRPKRTHGIHAVVCVQHTERMRDTSSSPSTAYNNVCYLFSWARNNWVSRREKERPVGAAAAVVAEENQTRHRENTNLDGFFFTDTFVSVILFI